MLYHNTDSVEQCFLEQMENYLTNVIIIYDPSTARN